MGMTEKGKRCEVCAGRLGVTGTSCEEPRARFVDREGRKILMFQISVPLTVLSLLYWIVDTNFLCKSIWHVP